MSNIGKRIRLIKMDQDPNPISPMSEGTIRHIGGNVINVSWDNGRTLGICCDVDKYEIFDYIIQYWAGNRMFPTLTFNTFEDAWDHVVENLEEENLEDIFVVENKYE